ncbi:MAG: hypothetical protein Q9162_003968 [Coniocarpon cinnabarinum]
MPPAKVAGLLRGSSRSQRNSVQQSLRSRAFSRSSLALDNEKQASKAGDRKPRTIFSGIQPTGIAHLGNYLGAIQPWVKLQNDAQAKDKLYFSVVDLHSFTSRSLEPDERRVAKTQTLAILLAAGLDPAKCTLFHQSSVKQHAELHWLLECRSGMGWLSRIPTWREKLMLELNRTEKPDDAGEDGDLNFMSLLQFLANPKSQERLELGLFVYPVLQAADILLYQTTHVPVGADQLVNIEFARGAATTFNATYGKGGAIDPNTKRKMKGQQILTLPEPIVSNAKRIMSLSEPGKKMSKSSPDPRGRILVTDSPEEIRKKVKSALTDTFADQGEGVSYDPERRPGVSNLIDIVAYVEQANGKQCEPGDVVAEFGEMQVAGSILRVLKERATEAVIQHLTPVRERYNELMSRSGKKMLHSMAREGALHAAQEAEKTMKTVREVVGL